ncbi:MAG TPA: helix-turn-helix domain-containing protein [Anaerolineales bacterium]|nr:helix-turn-helix domain-containing protein [Anaerolineales bacterium]
MADSRSRIFEFLKRRGSASVAELSRGLGLTPVTIRHHLEALLAEGLVEVPSPRRKPGPGRPEMAYRLAPSADRLLPRNYGELCECLLSAMQEGSAGSVGSALAAAGTALGRSRVSGTSPSRETRLRAAQGFLESRGYFPSWDRKGAGSVLVLSNCPYLEVVQHVPAVCRFDLAILEAVLGGSVHLESSIAQHDACCRLRMTDAGAL